MKIATFNINNINKRLTNLLDWIRVAEPDVVCLQELKATDAEFPADVIRRAGYEAVWRGQKGWNGVAILARGTTPILTRTELPGNVRWDQRRLCSRPPPSPSRRVCRARLLPRAHPKNAHPNSLQSQRAARTTLRGNDR